jgi:asparagine synthetase B (glutamine-hydrolysing)
MSARIPSNLKLNRNVSTGFQNKYIIKQIVDPHVPANVCRRSKMGFSMPFEAYLDEGGILHQLLRDNVTKANIEKRGILKWSAVEKMLNQNCKGHSTSLPGLSSYPWRYDWATTYGLWSILVMELWFQEYIDK